MDDPDISIAFQVIDRLIKADMCQVSVAKKHNRCKLLHPLNEAQIDQVWTDRLAHNNKLYNGTKFRLHSVIKNTTKPLLHLQLGITCYKDFLGTNWSPLSSEILEMGKRDYGNSQAYMSDALGVGALLMTVDGRVVIIKRSQHCGEAAGLWDVPGGHPEPQELVGRISMEDIDVESLSNCDVIKEIYSSILREIQDEINIPQTVLSEPELMGIARNETSAGRPSVEFFIRCSLDSTEIINLYYKGNQREADESTQIKLLSACEVLELKEKNSKLWNYLAPSAKGCFTLFKNLVTENILILN